MCPSVADARVERAIEAHKGVGRRVIEINRVVDCCGVEAFLHEVDLLLLEGGGDVDLVAHAQEDRPRIVRQALDQMGVKRRQVEMRPWRRSPPCRRGRRGPESPTP